MARYRTSSKVGAKNKQIYQVEDDFCRVTLKLVIIFIFYCDTWKFYTVYDKKIYFHKLSCKAKDFIRDLGIAR